VRSFPPGNRAPRPPAWLAALAAAGVAARLGVLLLGPRRGLIAPFPVDVAEHFSGAEIERARAYRRPQLRLAAARSVMEGALLLALVRRPPAPLIRLGPHRALNGARAGALLSGGLTAATLPLAVLSRRRGLAAGLLTQSWEGWATDVAKSAGIGAGLAGTGAAGTLELVRRWPRQWWLPGSALLVGVSAISLVAGPTVIDPLFNRFTALAAGPLRDDVLELAGRAGVDVGEVYTVDASRRTTAANAYVTGLGPTKRVVLYDTLIDGFTRQETRSVVAHELAHVRHRDVSAGVAYLALIAPASLHGVARLTERLSATRPSEATPTPALLPALAVSVGVVAAIVGSISSALSRRIEARADAFALRLTDEPEPFVSFERRISLLNLSDPDPPAWQTALLASHPPTAARIGIAQAYAAGVR